MTKNRGTYTRAQNPKGSHERSSLIVSEEDLLEKKMVKLPSGLSMGLKESGYNLAVNYTTTTHISYLKVVIQQGSTTYSVLREFHKRTTSGPGLQS